MKGSAFRTSHLTSQCLESLTERSQTKTIPLSIHTHLFPFYREWKEKTPNPNRLKQVKQPLYTDKTFTKVNWSNPELKLNCADFQWSHQSCNTNKSQLFTHSARPLRNVPQEALTFVFCVCAILKACTHFVFQII